MVLEIPVEKFVINLFTQSTQKIQKNSEGESEEPENKDHLAYLTSS